VDVLANADPYVLAIEGVQVVVIDAYGGERLAEQARDKAEVPDAPFGVHEVQVFVPLAVLVGPLLDLGVDRGCEFDDLLAAFHDADVAACGKEVGRWATLIVEPLREVNGTVPLACGDLRKQDQGVIVEFDLRHCDSPEYGREKAELPNAAPAGAAIGNCD